MAELWPRRAHPVLSFSFVLVPFSYPFLCYNNNNNNNNDDDDDDDDDDDNHNNNNNNNKTTTKKIKYGK